ncbi:MAG: cytochrome c3 family protein [Desulfobulbaceae bacterium]
MRKILHLPITAAAAVLYLACAGAALGVMNGPCSGCHTMHNSQDNLPMRFDSSVTPLPQLLRGDCYGCHAQGVAQALYPLNGVDVIPQVYHTDPLVDLAGGNFAYIDGAKGGAASDAKGHNISDLWSVGTDATLYAPPGGIVLAFHDDGFNVNTNELTCAGTNGCHGNRYSGIAGYEGITGAHHNNVNGAVTQGGADIEPGHGYRFLLGVNGLEDTDWQYTKSATDHNEYSGRATPIQLDCSTGGCHLAGGVRPPNGTMAEYCGTCHGNFHTLETATSSGIGANTTDPFIRHPSDLAIPGTGEYTAYTTYLTITPVARIGAVPGAASGTVTPGGADAVFCLSCHVAHGSPYPDMLKWDYTAMQVGNGGAATGTGCFACHSSKD